MSTYTGHLLRVDLSSASVTREPIPLDLQRKFVGGRGFGISYLFEEMHKGIDPACNLQTPSEYAEKHFDIDKE